MAWIEAAGPRGHRRPEPELPREAVIGEPEMPLPDDIFKSGFAQ